MMKSGLRRDRLMPMKCVPRFSPVVSAARPTESLPIDTDTQLRRVVRSLAQASRVAALYWIMHARRRWRPQPCGYLPHPLPETHASDGARRQQLRPLVAPPTHEERAASDSTSSTTRLHVASTLVDVCDSYDSATSLMVNLPVLATPAAGSGDAATTAEVLAARMAGTARATAEGRKSLSTGAPPPTSLSSTYLQSDGRSRSPVQWTPRAHQSAPATVSDQPAGAPAATAAAQQPLPPPPPPTAPPAAAHVGPSEFANASPAPSALPMPCSPQHPPPRRSLSSSGIPRADGGDSSAPWRQMVGVRSWEPRAQSMQLSAQMTAAARGKPGDDCSTLFDAMGRPVPLAHAFSSAAAEAPANVSRRSSLRVPFARADATAVSNSFEATYAPGVLTAPHLSATASVISLSA